MSSVGVSRRQRDGDPKGRGATRFVADMDMPGLLHARLVLAAEAHARIEGIDAGEALAVPGVVAVLTAEDLGIVGGGGRTAEPLAREEVVFSGQPVALVLAETEAAAEDGAGRVFVDESPLPTVLDLEAAMAPDAAPARISADTGGDGAASAHTDAPEGDSADDDAPNVAARQHLRNGDAAAGLAAADAVVSARFQ